jgi:hypothetical protein
MRTNLDGGGRFIIVVVVVVILLSAPADETSEIILASSNFMSPYTSCDRNLSISISAVFNHACSDSSVNFSYSIVFHDH